MEIVIAIIGAAAQVLVVLLGSTIVFDIVHYLLHRWTHSKNAWLRAVGDLHEIHHRFLDRDLVVHPELTRANLTHHVIPEYLTHVTFTLVLAVWLPLPVVLGTLTIQTLVAGYILEQRGQDINHRSIEKLRAYRPMFFCVPEYHALHHVYPDAHFSSWIKPLDWLLRTGIQLAGKYICIDGADTPFRAALRAGLERRGATTLPVDRSDYADILVLLNGDEDSEAAQTFSARARERKVPPEIWTVSGATMRYERDRNIIHRRLAVSPDRATPTDAESLLTNIERGFGYVPIRLSPQDLFALVDFRRQAGAPRN